MDRLGAPRTESSRRSRSLAGLRSLGFVILCFVPFAYIVVAGSYGRNLFYVAKPEADRYRV